MKIDGAAVQHIYEETLEHWQDDADLALLAALYLELRSILGSLGRMQTETRRLRSEIWALRQNLAGSHDLDEGLLLNTDMGVTFSDE